MIASMRQSAAARLARDPYLWTTAGLGLAILAPSFFPLLSPAALAALNGRWSDAILLLCAVAALVAGSGAAPSVDERRFWRLLAAGLGCFLLVELGGLAGLIASGRGTASALQTLLFVGLYVFAAIALELKPHVRHAEPERWRWRRRLEAAGVVVLGLGLLAYFVLLPELFAQRGLQTSLPSLMVYAAFDSYLIVRGWQLRAATADRGWRSVYTLLLAVFVLWWLADVAEAARWAGWLSPAALGRLLDILWLPPYLGLVLAARLRRAQLAAAGTKVAEPPAGAPEEDHSAWALWRRPLWLQAALLPLAHELLAGAGALDPGAEPAQQVCAVVVLVAIGSLAVVDQRRLERESRRLEHERQEAREAELRAHHDPLTGLPNRFLLIDHLRLAIAQARRDERRVGLVFLDLDRFKVVNDSLGHVEGDRVLHAVAERLGSEVRSGDTLGRVGGDEFVLVAPALRAAADARTVAGKLVAALRRPFTVEGVELFVSASVGVAVFPEDGEEVEDLLRRADRSMFRAKEQGGDRVVLDELHHDSGGRRLLSLETALRKGREEGAFHLLYQPIWDLSTGRVRACEALLRWSHPLRGVLSPAEFLDVAESSGVLARMTPWLLATACHAAAGWSPVAGVAVAVSVNLSARQFLDPELPRHVEGALAEVRTPGPPAAARDHRERRHGPPRADGRGVATPARDGGADRHRRLRDRLLVARPPPAPAARRAEDRRLLRPRARPRTDRVGHRRDHPGDGRLPRPDRDRRRGGAPGGARLPPRARLPVRPGVPARQAARGGGARGGHGSRPVPGGAGQLRAREAQGRSAAPIPRGKTSWRCSKAGARRSGGPTSRPARVAATVPSSAPGAGGGCA